MKVSIVDADNLTEPPMFEQKHEGASCVDVTITPSDVFTTSFEAGYRLVINVPNEYQIMKSVSHSIGEVVIFVTGA